MGVGGGSLNIHLHLKCWVAVIYLIQNTKSRDWKWTVKKMQKQQTQSCYVFSFWALHYNFKLWMIALKMDNLSFSITLSHLIIQRWFTSLSNVRVNYYHSLHNAWFHLCPELRHFTESENVENRLLQSHKSSLRR